MNDRKLRSLFLDTVHVLEWHDGLIRAIGTCQDEFYLIALVAWDLERATKAYLVLSLDRSTADEMIKCTEKERDGTQITRWHSFNSLFDEYVSTYDGSVYLVQGLHVVCKEIPVGKEIPLVERDQEDLKYLKRYDLEAAIRMEALARWLGQQ